MQANEMLQSKTIAFLRFPLIVGVVLIHSTFSGLMMGGVLQIEAGVYPVYESMEHLFSHILTHIAVPLFFFFSGYLLFCKTDGYSAETYWQKLKKRAKTLLIPYLIWNLLIIGFYFIAESFFSGMLSGSKKSVMDYTWSDWFWAFWDAGYINPEIADGTPINGPLWFIRDLMLAVALSPIVYVAIKQLRHYVVLLLVVLWILNIGNSYLGFSVQTFVFFPMGAYFGIYRKNFVSMCKPALLPLTVAYGIVVIVEFCFWDGLWMNHLHQVGILVGMAFGVSLCAHFIEKGSWKNNAFLAGSSFFVYAFHVLPLSFVKKIMFKLFHPHSDILVTVLYFLCPTFTILLGLGIYGLLKRYLPRLTAVITGGR